MTHPLVACTRVLLLLVFAATFVLWGCGRQRFGAVFWIGEQHSDMLSVGRSGLTIGRSVSYATEPGFAWLEDPSGIDYWHVVSPVLRMQFNWAGWAVDYDSIPAIYAPRTTLDQCKVHVPWWSLILMTGCGPAAMVVRAVWRRRRELGTCRRCGYDLRATPDRCPECGTPVPRQEAIT